MDRKKELGRKGKEARERIYHIKGVFFHGDMNDEEDRDIFFTAVSEIYGNANYIICNNN